MAFESFFDRPFGHNMKQSQSPLAPDSLSQYSADSPSWSMATVSSTNPSTVHSTSAVPTAAELVRDSDMSFTTAADVFTRLETTDGDVLTVANVPPYALQDMDREREARSRKVRFFYFAEQKLIIVTIPTGPHEQLYGNLEGRFISLVYSMGLGPFWRRTISGRFPTNPSTGSSGEGDTGGQPLPARERWDAWPTLVVEAGYSQTLASLRTKMRFWFMRSNHEVKLVLLAKAFPREKRILYEQWRERPRPSRPGATTTRSVHMLDAVCLQTINVVWALQTPYQEASKAIQTAPASFNVTRGPLVLDFSSCFLREPAGPQEHNFVFSDWDLQMCAVSVWQVERPQFY